MCEDIDVSGEEDEEEENLGPEIFYFTIFIDYM